MQMVEEGLAAMFTLAAREELTIIVIALDVAGDPVAQIALEVITQVITSLLTKEELE